MMNLANAFRRQSFSVSKGFCDLFNLLPEHRIAGNETSFDQRLSFPQQGTDLVILAESTELKGQKSGFARGAELHVDFVCDAFFRRRGEISNEFLSDTNVVF